MKKSQKELNRLKRIDEHSEFLSRCKMERIMEERLEQIDKGEKLEEEDFRLLKDLNVYECSLSLPDQNDVLLTHMQSFETPTVEEWLEITPMSSVHYSADLYKKNTGIDVGAEAFNSYQRVRNNPDLLSFRKLNSAERRKLIFGDMTTEEIKEKLFGRNNGKR